MAKDNREVLQSIRTLVSAENRTARILGENDLDEIAGMYSQKELNALRERGILSGDWVSAKDDDDNEQTSSLSSLDDSAEELAKHTRPQLVQRALELGIKTGEKQTKAEISNLILNRQN